jgi:hypothetical protein
MTKTGEWHSEGASSIVSERFSCRYLFRTASQRRMLEMQYLLINTIAGFEYMSADNPPVTDPEIRQNTHTRWYGKR